MALLVQGNGHQRANKRVAMAFVEHHCEAEIIDDSSMSFPPFGACNFAAYTDETGAFVSSPHGSQHYFGDVPEGRLDHVVMFRDFGDRDDRVAIYVCPTVLLLMSRGSAGDHGVSWTKVGELSMFTQLWRLGPTGAPREVRVLKRRIETS